MAWEKDTTKTHFANNFLLHSHLPTKLRLKLTVVFRTYDTDHLIYDECSTLVDTNFCFKIGLHSTVRVYLRWCDELTKKAFFIANIFKMVKRQ